MYFILCMKLGKEKQQLEKNKIKKNIKIKIYNLELLKLAIL